MTNVRPTGVPGTALANGIVNPAAVVGILGQNMAAYQQMLQAHPDSDLPAEHTTADSIELLALDPEHVADQIVYAINQPLGVPWATLRYEPPWMRTSFDRVLHREFPATYLSPQTRKASWADSSSSQAL